MRKITAEYQRVIDLALAGHTVAEICAKTGIKRNALRSIMLRIGMWHDRSQSPPRWRVPEKYMPKSTRPVMLSVDEGLRVGYQLAGIKDLTYNP